MLHNAHDAYVETRVLSAGPMELVRILYQTAAGSVSDARRYLGAGDVLARSRAISKACEVLLELTGALDFASGGEIAQRLAQLYEYMLHRLTEANFKQIDAPLGEVLALLTTLSEAWAAVGTSPQPPAVEPSERWTPPAMPLETAAPAHAWSF